MNADHRATLTAARDALNVLLGESAPGAVVDQVLSAPLGFWGERTWGWLQDHNDALRAAYPTGYVGKPEPGFGEHYERKRLVLISGILDPRILARPDLTAAQRDSVQAHCHERGYGALMRSTRDEMTGLMRLPVCWVPGIIPEGAPAEGIIAIATNVYRDDTEIQMAILRHYEIAGYALPPV